MSGVDAYLERRRVAAEYGAALTYLRRLQGHGADDEQAAIILSWARGGRVSHADLRRIAHPRTEQLTIAVEAA